MTDVLLINPPMWSPKAQAAFSTLCPPLGLGYLAACLIKEGISVEIVDLNLSSDPMGHLKAVFTEASPRMVGLTTLTQNYALALQVAMSIKAMDGRGLVVIGGPHTTYTWQETLATKAVDVVVRFEGEQTIVELFRQISSKKTDLSCIDGIAYRDGDSPVLTSTRPYEENLDNIPFPARHLLPMAHYGRPGTIMTSRGCPYKCIFCISSTYEGKYRMRSPENVVDELAVLRHVWDIREIYFLDNVFTVDAERVQHICRQIIELRLGIRFHCVSRVDLITKDLVEILKAAGCHRIEIGVESAEQKIIDAMQKHITLEQVLQAADIVLGAGLQPMFTFQFGSPFDTVASIEKAHQLAARLRSKGAITFFSIMTPYPGTPLAERVEEFSISIRAKNCSEYRTSNPVYDTGHLDRASFRRALYRESVI